MTDIPQKHRANAVSAYLMIGVSSLFLLNKNNPALNNAFVIHHTKRALIIHISYLLNWMIFLGFQPLHIPLFGSYQLDDIIAAGIFILLTGYLGGAIYQAHRGKYTKHHTLFKTYSASHISVGTKKSDAFDEAYIMRLIIAHIPFLGAHQFGRYKDDQHIQDIDRLNQIVTLVLIFITILGHYSFASFISLLYIIYIVFVALRLIGEKRFYTIQLPSSLSFGTLLFYIRCMTVYLKGYFKKQGFKNFSQVQTHISEQEQQQDMTDMQVLKSSKYFFLKRNGAMLILSMIVTTLFVLAGSISSAWLLCIGLMTLYYVGMVSTTPSYKIPFLYDICSSIVALWYRSSSLWVRTKKLHQKQEDIIMKVK